MKIGILIPRSTLYPAMGFDMLDGLKASLDLYQPGSSHSFVTENIGFGGTFPDVISAVERLLIQHEVDLIVGYLHHHHAHLLQGTLAASGRMILALDSGYELPVEETHQENIFRVSLNGYIAARQAVKVSFTQGVRHSVTSLSYYDAGYRMPVAFDYATKLGGSTKGTFVTPLKTSDFTLEPLLTHLQADMPDAIYASFCQEMAIQYFQEAAKHEILRTPKMVGAPFMLEESYLKNVQWPGFAVQGCATWARSLDNASNTKAKAQMLTHRKKELNLFSLMAWEAGQLIAECISEGEGTETHVQALRKAILETPRGKVRMDARNNTTVAPVYDLKTAPSAEGGTEVVVLGESPGWQEQVEAWYADVAAGMGHGTSWRNLYTCI